MTRGLTALVLVGTVLSSLASAQPAGSQDRAEDAKAIRAHIESIFQAFIDKDRQKLEETHGLNWRGFTSWSERPIRGRDGYMREATFPPGTPKGQGLVAYRMSEFDVVFYGATAVASFVAEVDLLAGTETRHQKLTLLDVYHQEPGGWIQVASNTSLHPEEADQQRSRLRSVSGDERASLFAAREAVWRAWFAGDVEGLTKLVPPELVTIESRSGTFGTRDNTLAESRGFAASGAKLTRLAFPHTEIQAYGNTAILYTKYETDIVEGGRTRTEHGTATEVFVNQNGRWVNTGWQLAPNR